jgi:uncharacterized protein YfbU (UPF0304 family)
MKLSDGEKLILLMLADISKRIEIKGEYDPDFISGTIYDDHLWGFRSQYSGIPFEKQDSPPEVSETVDILYMWHFLEDSHKELSAADKTKVEKEAEPFGKYVQFPGFDANNEEHYGIATYLIDRLGRFQFLKGRDINSHSPSIEGYRRMYNMFDPMRPSLGRKLLSADDIIQILGARHP